MAKNEKPMPWLNELARNHNCHGLVRIISKNLNGSPEPVLEHHHHHHRSASRAFKPAIKKDDADEKIYKNDEDAIVKKIDADQIQPWSSNAEETNAQSLKQGQPVTKKLEEQMGKTEDDGTHQADHSMITNHISDGGSFAVQQVSFPVSSLPPTGGDSTSRLTEHLCGIRAMVFGGSSSSGQVGLPPPVSNLSMVAVAQVKKLDCQVLSLPPLPNKVELPLSSTTATRITADVQQQPLIATTTAVKLAAADGRLQVNNRTKNNEENDQDHDQPVAVATKAWRHEYPLVRRLDGSGIRPDDVVQILTPPTPPTSKPEFKSGHEHASGGATTGGTAPFFQRKLELENDDQEEKKKAEEAQEEEEKLQQEVDGDDRRSSSSAITVVVDHLCGDQHRERRPASSSSGRITAASAAAAIRPCDQCCDIINISGQVAPSPSSKVVKLPGRQPSVTVGGQHFQIKLSSLICLACRDRRQQCRPARNNHDNEAATIGQQHVAQTGDNHHCQTCRFAGEDQQQPEEDKNKAVIQLSPPPLVGDFEIQLKLIAIDDDDDGRPRFASAESMHVDLTELYDAFVSSWSKSALAISDDHLLCCQNCNNSHSGSKHVPKCSVRPPNVRCELCRRHRGHFVTFPLFSSSTDSSLDSVGKRMVDEKSVATVAAATHRHHHRYHPHHHPHYRRHCMNGKGAPTPPPPPPPPPAPFTNGTSSSSPVPYRNGYAVNGGGQKPIIGNGSSPSCQTTKRPSSVSSSNSNESSCSSSATTVNGKTKDWSLDTDSSGDYEYGPGIVDRLRHKFMALSHKQQQEQRNQAAKVHAMIKRCSSLEELTFQTLTGKQKQLVLRNGVAGEPSGRSQHQLVNGTKKKLLLMSGHGKNSCVGAKKVVASPNHEPVAGGTKLNASLATPPPPPPPAPALYPTNIVKQFVQNQNAKFQTLPPPSPPLTVASTAANPATATTMVNGGIKRNVLLLGAPMPYIKRSKSVETLSSFAPPILVPVSPVENGTLSPVSKLTVIEENGTVATTTTTDNSGVDGPLAATAMKDSKHDDNVAAKTLLFDPHWKGSNGDHHQGTNPGSLANENDDDDGVVCGGEGSSPVVHAIAVDGDEDKTSLLLPAAIPNHHHHHHHHRHHQQQHQQQREQLDDQQEDSSQNAIIKQEEDDGDDEVIDTPQSETTLAAGSSNTLAPSNADDGVVVLLEDSCRSSASLSLSVSVIEAATVATSNKLQVVGETVSLAANNDQHQIESTSSGAAVVPLSEPTTTTMATTTGTAAETVLATPTNARNIVDASELPKPDTVKTVKRMFECSSSMVKSSPTEITSSSVSMTRPSTATSMDNQVRSSSRPGTTNRSPAKTPPAPSTANKLAPSKPPIASRQNLVGVSGAKRKDYHQRNQSPSTTTTPVTKVKPTPTVTTSGQQKSEAELRCPAKLSNHRAFSAKPEVARAPPPPKSPPPLDETDRTPSSFPSSGQTNCYGTPKTPSSLLSAPLLNSASGVHGKLSSTTTSSPVTANGVGGDRNGNQQLNGVGVDDNCCNKDDNKKPPFPSVSPDQESGAASVVPSSVVTNKKPVANIRPFSTSAAVTNCNGGNHQQQPAFLTSTPTPISPTANLTGSSQQQQQQPSKQPVVVNGIDRKCLSSPVPPRASSPAVAGSGSPSNKMMVNKDQLKSNSDLASLKPSLLQKQPPTADNGSAAKSTLWSLTSKPPSKTSSSCSSSSSSSASGGSSSIVFDFRDNKNIKPNIAIQPTPFGAKPIPKRIIKEMGVDVGGHGADEDEDEEDSNYCGMTEVPPPSGILFKGENVIVGSGSLLHKRNKKLSISFNESETSVFEYLRFEEDDEDEDEDEDDAGIVDNDEGGAGGPNISVTAPSSSNPIANLVNSIQTPPPNGLNKTRSFPSGDSNLASYKPSRTETNTSFELGVTKKSNGDMSTINGHHRRHNGDGTTTTTTASTPTTDDDCDNPTTMIKPARVEDNVAFSHATTASDLLF